MTNTNDRDVAADRVEALKKWEIELIGASIAVTPLMRSAYCDGWKARAAISSAVPDGGKDSELRGIERAYQAAKDAGKEPGWANHYANALQAIRALIQGMK